MSGVDYVEDPIDHVARLTVDRHTFNIHLSISFNATPVHLYKDATPTIVTVSATGLPPLDPDTFSVNLPRGVSPPPGSGGDALYGGETGFVMPDGEGTLASLWLLTQTRAGSAVGQVSYQSDGASKPFLGGNSLQIQAVMQLRPLSFDGIGEEDNHYEWGAFCDVTGLAGVGPLPTYSGKAASSQVLRFVLSVTLDPPSASFFAG